MRILPLLALAALGLSAQTLHTFGHPHLGEGDVRLTGSVSDPVIENHSTKTVHAVTVQLVDAEGQGPVMVIHGAAASDVKPGESKKVFGSSVPVTPNPTVSVRILNVTFADGSGGGEFVGTDRGAEFNLIQRELAKRNITVYRRD